MKTAERQLKKMHRRTLVLLALLVAIAFPAAAHNRTPLGDLSSTPSPAIAWNEPLGEPSGDELPIIDAATIAAFDEAAQIDINLPADPLAELDAHLAAIIASAETELLPIVSGLENRCSGFAVSLTEANLKETGELSLKLHWGRDHVRNRWFDPNTGTWLTPDPLGYQDSSNLYAFCGGDPVNGRDPLGLGDDDRVNRALDSFWSSWAGQAVSSAAQEVNEVVETLADSGGRAARLLWTRLIGPSQIVTTEARELQESDEIQATRGAWGGAQPGRVIQEGVKKEGGDVVQAGGTELTRQAIYAAGGVYVGRGFDEAAEEFARTGARWSKGATKPALGVVEAQAERKLLPAAREVPTLDDNVYRRSARDVSVSPHAPDVLPFSRPIGLSSTQNGVMQADLQEAIRLGARDIRVNQQQLGVAGARVGINRPDLQFSLGGKRYYIEYDTPASGRGLAHQTRILSNDLDAVVILKIVP